MLINEFVIYFESVLGRSKRTCWEYEKELRYFAARLCDTLPASDVLCLTTRPDVEAYIADCMAEGNTESTRARKISCLRSWFRWAVDRGHISQDPIAAMPRPRIPSSLPRFLILSEARQLIRSARGRQDLFYRRRNTLIIVWLLNTGLRLSELASICLQDLSDDIVLIHGKGKRGRFVHLNQACRRAERLWLAHRGSDSDYLLVSKQGSPLSSAAIASVVKSELDRAGLSSRGLSTHKLRHTCATLMYRSGTDIRLLQSVLGHASIATTQVYTHVMDDQLIAAYKSHPLADF